MLRWGIVRTGTAAPALGALRSVATVATWGCLLLAGAATLSAQVPADTTRADTGRAARAADGAGTGAAKPDSGATGAPGGQVPNAAGPGGAAASPAVPPAAVYVAPTDTTLARACDGAPAGTEAPGLLAVLFRTGTSDRDRAAAAKAVGGTLAGTSDYGEEYVRVPETAGPLVAVADRLILQEPVTQVSPAPCPEPPGAAAP
jgi:hypothetical protein